ncbi:GNAT family N-acetyltransferase [Photobacterium sp. OFAV2-7]|uniref:GNAT family N-acetyltransferase n=1 Tax=Photobacterium sp. OFAV2-7 TaxID=2917748 RepID=UPI001EF3FBB2|nr:GNAT family N-acetyltransferase [Photobacterium sp. OFAV2-7]MCG7586804.1 GNAT family N-acetyltransferase [Photobacterium sp. OFAV2-7]
MIRKAKPEDYKLLVELFMIENEHNAALAPDVVNRTKDVLTESELTEILSDDNQYLYVVEQDGVAGVLLGNVVKVDGKRWNRPRTYGYVEELVVAETARGQGYAKSLICHFEVWAKDHGADSVELHVWAKNSVANQCYAKVGFKSKQYLLSKSL